jgi:hypothetical protein
MLERLRRGAFAALGGGLWLSIACGGDAAEPPRQGSTSQSCARFVECVNRADLQAECEGDLADRRTDATEAGCTAFYDEFLSCDAQHPGTCDPNVKYTLAPECERAREAVDDCIRDRGPEQCSYSTPPCMNPPCLSHCNIECGDFAADCSGSPGQPLSCACTKGAGTGRQFSAADCGSVNEDAARSCR